MEKSLHEKRILITREEKQGKQFAKKIRQYNGNPVEVPLLKISCKDHPDHQNIFQRLADYQWIFFTSANGVEYFFQLAEKYNLNIDMLKFINIAAVGHKTERVLKNYGFSASFIPSVYNAEVMAKEFFNKYKEISPVLIVRGSKSLDILPKEFKEYGQTFDVMEVYESLFRSDMKEHLNVVLRKETIDFITFTSPSSVEAFHAIAGVNNHVPSVCIGTTTEKKALQLGFDSILVPEVFTIEGMIDCMGTYISKKELEDNGK